MLLISHCPNEIGKPFQFVSCVWLGFVPDYNTGLYHYVYNVILLLYNPAQLNNSDSGADTALYMIGAKENGLGFPYV